MGKYTQKIIDFVESGNPEVSDWIKQFPLQDQPDIMREIKSYVQQKAIENGHYEFAASFDDFDEKVNKFENAVIDELAQKQEQEQLNKQVEEAKEKLTEQYFKLKNHIIQGILKQDENFEGYLDFAKKMIDNEKEFNVYDEEDWEPILHLL